jgi:hypothetical protein
MPGTEINVTPEIEVPIMAMATTYHGDFLSPTKKARLLEPVRRVVQ